MFWKRKVRVCRQIRQCLFWNKKIKVWGLERENEANGKKAKLRREKRPAEKEKRLKREKRPREKTGPEREVKPKEKMSSSFFLILLQASWTTSQIFYLSVSCFRRSFFSLSYLTIFIRSVSSYFSFLLVK